MTHFLLFADNEPGVRQYLKQELEEDGFHVVLTRDGVETLELLEKLLVDVVILDEHMPRCSGLETAKRIKLLHPDLPVILFTADQNFENYKSPCVDATVLKSENLNPLKATITGLLSCQKAAAVVPGEPPGPAWMDARMACGR
jgi:two-component system response regulator